MTQITRIYTDFYLACIIHRLASYAQKRKTEFQQEGSQCKLQLAFGSLKAALQTFPLSIQSITTELLQKSAKKKNADDTDLTDLNGLDLTEWVEVSGMCIVLLMNFWVFNQNQIRVNPFYLLNPCSILMRLRHVRKNAGYLITFKLVQRQFKYKRYACYNKSQQTDRRHASRPICGI